MSFLLNKFINALLFVILSEMTAYCNFAQKKSRLVSPSREETTCEDGFIFRQRVQIVVSSPTWRKRLKLKSWININLSWSTTMQQRITLQEKNETFLTFLSSGPCQRRRYFSNWNDPLWWIWVWYQQRLAKLQLPVQRYSFQRWQCWKWIRLVFLILFSNSDFLFWFKFEKISLTM